MPFHRYSRTQSKCPSPLEAGLSHMKFRVVKTRDLVLRSSRSERLEGRAGTLFDEAVTAPTALTWRIWTRNVALTHSSFETAASRPPQDEALGFAYAIALPLRGRKGWGDRREVLQDVRGV